MQKIYHTTPTGQVRQCYANNGKCPYGSNQHFKDKDAAKKSVEERLTEEHSATGTITKSAFQEDSKKLLKKIKEYKTEQSLDKKFDEVMSEHSTAKEKEKFLKAIAENHNTSEKTLMKIASLSAHFNGHLIQNTKNRRLVELAYLNKYTDVRKAALSNLLTTDNDLYAVTLKYNETYYKKDYIRKLRQAGYSTAHMKQHSTYKNTTMDSEVKSIEKFINTYSKKYNGSGKLTNNNARDIRKFLESKRPSEYKGYIRLTVDSLMNAEKIDKYHNIINTKLKVKSSPSKNKTQINYSSVPLNKTKPKPHTNINSNKISTQSHDVNDVTKLDQFKNTKPMAKYEDSIELQQRWDKGLQDLPVEIQKEILRKKPQNSQEGLRAVVDIFKTTDKPGEMAKNGLLNFVNHIENLKKKNVNDGYIAVDEPEFKTPSGLIKVEEHIGNRDYGERITFRINGEKFEIGKPMLSDNWTSFLHIQEETSIEPVKKKSFWAKLFSKDN